MRHLASLLLVLGLYVAPVYAGEPAAPEAPAAATTESTESTPVVAPVPAPEAPAAEAPDADAEKKSGAIPGWLQALISVIGLAVTAFLLPFLKRKAEAAKAEAKRQSAQATEHDINARGILVSRLQEFLWGTAESIAEKKFPELAESVKNGDLNSKEAIKKELHSWGGILRQDAMAYFGNQGVDVIAAVGDEFLDKLIERAANKVSPFPGKETAKELLQSYATDWIIKHGVNWVRQKYIDSAMRGSDVAPSATEG